MRERRGVEGRQGGGSLKFSALRHKLGGKIQKIASVHFREILIPIKTCWQECFGKKNYTQRKEAERVFSPYSLLGKERGNQG